MNEKSLQLRQFLKLICVMVFAMLYAWAGMEHLWLRRFVAPLWLGLSMFFLSRNWKCLLQIPLLMLTLSLGYGANDLVVKIIKRLFFGFANGMTAIVHNKGFLLALHITLCCLVIVALGVWNPLNSRAEELLIGLIIGLLPMFMVEEKT